MKAGTESGRWRTPAPPRTFELRYRADLPQGRVGQGAPPTPRKIGEERPASCPTAPRNRSVRISRTGRSTGLLRAGIFQPRLLLFELNSIVAHFCIPFRPKLAIPKTGSHPLARRSGFLRDAAVRGPKPQRAASTVAAQVFRRPARFLSPSQSSSCHGHRRRRAIGRSTVPSSASRPYAITTCWKLPNPLKPVYGSRAASVHTSTGCPCAIASCSGSRCRGRARRVLNVQRHAEPLTDGLENSGRSVSRV